MRPLTLSALALMSLAACTAPETNDDAEVQEEEEIQEEQVERRDLPEGVDDSFSQQACSLLDGTQAELIAASSESEAGQALIVPDGETDLYEIVLPETGEGFVTVEIPDWMTTVRFFADENANYSITDAEELTGLRQCGACPEEPISDNRYAFHEWGSYTMVFDADSPRKIWLAVFSEG
ncbi:MAG: hypothetical protein ACI9VR_001929 [Cognaticolwellia sp.]|jgi:hypothetical protein